MSRVGRAVEMSQTTGIMKLIVETATRRILGAAILGVGGDEAIHGIINLMSTDQTVDALRWAVPIHPPVSELQRAFNLSWPIAGIPGGPET